MGHLLIPGAGGGVEVKQHSQWGTGSSSKENLLSEERKGIGKAKNGTCPSHYPCPFILLLAFEIYGKSGLFYNNPLNHVVE